MFNLDLFNTGVAVDNQSYDDTQFNATGKPLSPTKPDNGQPISTDFSNDTRSAWDYKQQARQAQLDTAGAYDTKNKIVMKDGYLIDKEPDSREAEMTKAASAYLDAYFDSNGDVGHAAMAGSKAVKGHRDMIKRQSMIPQLEATGRYQSMDLEKWAQTGNTQDLLTNAGKWQNMGQGIETNTLTGESRQIPGYQQPQANLHYLKNPDGTYTAVNPKTNEVVGGTVGTPKAVPGTAATGGGIGLDDEEAGSGANTFQDPTTGQWFRRTTYANGREKVEPLSASAQKTMQEKATAGAPDANQQLVSEDLNTVNSATDDQLNKITGQVIGRSETARDFISSQDPEARKVYAASQRLSGQMGNAAISAAKAAGASGINTEAEIKRFTQGVPQIDYTSPENYKASVAKIQEYANNFRDQLIRGKGGKPAATAGSTSHLSDEDLLKKYGG